jgi:hypothetical protein
VEIFDTATGTWAFVDVLGDISLNHSWFHPERTSKVCLSEHMYTSCTVAIDIPSIKKSIKKAFGHEKWF